ncbi:MAG: hypothetical protein AAF740_08790, partial [Bacteroidota bacterium]
FFLPAQTQSHTFSLNTSKLIPFASTNVEVFGSYDRSNYLNVVNSSELRENTQNTVLGMLKLGTAFDFPFNLFNETNYTDSRAKSEEGETFVNQSLSNRFEVVFKPKSKGRFLVKTSSELFIPDLQNQSNSFHFIDIRASYNTEKFEYSLLFQNLLNENNFSQNFVSDFSTTIYSNNLQPRLFLIGISYSF